MISIHSEPVPGTLMLRFSGVLTKSDYQKILPILEDRISRFGKIHVYADMEEITSMKIPALWKHIPFDLKHFRDYRRVAIVGGEKWMDYMTRVSDALISAEIRHFSSEDKTIALNWVLGKPITPIQVSP